MLTIFLVIVVALSPCLAVLGLLAVASWRERLHDRVLTRQAALTYAIHRELGAVVAPIVAKGLTGPWRVHMAVPLAHPATVATLLAIVTRELAATSVGTREDYQLVLTKQPDAVRARSAAPRPRSAAAGRSPLAPDVAATAHSLALLGKGLTNGRQ
jgi:hypothetical protein